MPYKRLFFMIEGDDDERFFKKIIKPIFEQNYDSVVIWQHAQKKGKKIRDFIKSINAMGSDYLFAIDINNEPCVTAKKEKTQKKHPIIADINRIAILIKEIESWYLAGLNDTDARKLTGRIFRNTNKIIKEQFDNYKPKRFDSSIDFMIEILKHFSVNIAKKKNTSFNYFMEKYTNI